MLAIRLKRTGRRNYAHFRVIVQDHRFSPKSGRVVAYLGSYNPHTKETKIDKDEAKKYLGSGAQPSDRVARILKSEGIKLPAWVKLDVPGKKSIKHPEKLKRNRPADAPAPEPKPKETSAEPVEGAPTEPAAEESKPDSEPTEGKPTPEPETKAEEQVEQPETKSQEAKPEEAAKEPEQPQKAS